jgi:segregation and condensation protein A
MGTPLPTVRLAIFEGPLDVLLRLIQEQKLDITDLSLVAVTQQFLDHVQSLEKQDGPLLAGFLRVAAQLMVGKSQALLHEPQDEVDELEESLEEQLRGYERLKQLMATVAELQEDSDVAYQRTALVPVPILTPPTLVNYAPEDLVSALAAVLEEKEEALPAVARRTVHIETYVNRIGLLLTLHGRTGFRELIESAESLEEIVVAFLAVLEFLRSGEATVRQSGQYTDILILPVGAGPAAPEAEPVPDNIGVAVK